MGVAGGGGAAAWLEQMTSPIAQLQEMFPYCTRVDIIAALLLHKGNCDSATATQEQWARAMHMAADSLAEQMSSMYVSDSIELRVHYQEAEEYLHRQDIAQDANMSFPSCYFDAGDDEDDTNTSAEVSEESDEGWELDDGDMPFQAGATPPAACPVCFLVIG
eukprot:gene21701-26102_t